MIHPNIRREIAERYHRALPDDIRRYLKGRGIPATLIERKLLGWNGERISVPIFGREGEVIGFRHVKAPGDTTVSPEIRSDIGLGTELYGWETLARAPQRVVICARELDRLVLEGHGFPAVASTGGPAKFPEEWLPFFESIKRIYVCFDRDLAGAAAAKKIQHHLPRAHIVSLPADVGNSGGVSDFFSLGHTRIDFEVLLAAAAASGDSARTVRRGKTGELRPRDPSVEKRAERLKAAVRLHEVAARYTDLQASDDHLVGHCPFHDDASRSLVVYPQIDTYRCSVCRAEGDVVRFVMDKESMTYGQALEALERFRYTNDLHGTS